MRSSLAVTATQRSAPDGPDHNFFFSHITELRFWGDAAQRKHGLACLTPSLAGYGLDSTTIEPVARSRAFNQNSRVRILLIIINHQSSLSGILNDAYN